ncbi:hypothetical protein GCM10010172_29580 [Paractinoplanes ferrugineus]|uniref:Uncharacterized protein n=1 Tax=Paractinoplanes ferrugineus TaxID=113564 RepID=A0A919MPV2_9ACTN|nr:hypothetical protein Afe05nite_75170 [Actinoplanes ferrugineus]
MLGADVTAAQAFWTGLFNDVVDGGRDEPVPAPRMAEFGRRECVIKARPVRDA